MNINRRDFLVSLLAAPFIPKVEPKLIGGWDFGYKPSYSQLAFMNSDKRVFFYGGAAGGGKSYLMNKMMEDYYKHMLRKSNEALY